MNWLSLLSRIPGKAYAAVVLVALASTVITWHATGEKAQQRRVIADTVAKVAQFTRDSINNASQQIIATIAPTIPARIATVAHARKAVEQSQDAMRATSAKASVAIEGLSEVAKTDSTVEALVRVTQRLQADSARLFNDIATYARSVDSLKTDLQAALDATGLRVAFVTDSMQKVVDRIARQYAQLETRSRWLEIGGTVVGFVFGIFVHSQLSRD